MNAAIKKIRVYLRSSVYALVRSLRGRVFEIAERDLALLDEHKIHYTILPIPDSSGTDEAARWTPTLTNEGQGSRGEGLASSSNVPSSAGGGPGHRLLLQCISLPVYNPGGT